MRAGSGLLADERVAAICATLLDQLAPSLLAERAVNQLPELGGPKAALTRHQAGQITPDLLTAAVRDPRNQSRDTLDFLPQHGVVVLVRDHTLCEQGSFHYLSLSRSRHADIQSSGIAEIAPKRVQLALEGRG